MFTYGKIYHNVPLRGSVFWTLYDENSQEYKVGTNHNVITTIGRERIADLVIGSAVNAIGFVGIGTGTNTAVESNTALQTAVLYDGVNQAKAVDSKNIRGQFTSRFVTQFTPSQANANIRELGLFDAANSGKLIARVNVTINKTSTQRLTVYWYLTFDRSENVAIKTGTSVGATGTITAAVNSTLTFTNPATIVMIFNNSVDRIYFKFNGTMTGNPPTDYDFKLESGESYIQSNEEISISTVHVFTATLAGAMPLNTLTVRGW
ncbi:MAG: hypothetical protein AABY07_08985 [Nanoarchaeota archaeon]